MINVFSSCNITIVSPANVRAVCDLKGSFKHRAKLNWIQTNSLLSAQQVAQLAALWRKHQNTVNFIWSDMKGAAAALYPGSYAELSYQHRTKSSVSLADLNTTILCHKYGVDFREFIVESTILSDVGYKICWGNFCKQIYCKILNWYEMTDNILCLYRTYFINLFLQNLCFSKINHSSG